MPEHSALRQWLKSRVEKGEDADSYRALLEEFEQFFRYVFNGSVDGISILDLNYNILEVNDTMRRWYAHKGPLSWQKCYAAYHDHEVPCAECPTRRAIETGKPQIGTVPYDGPNHMIGQQELSVFPLFDDANNVFGLIEYVRDVTTLRSEELAIENLKKRLQFQHQTLQEQEVALRVLRKQGESDERRTLGEVAASLNTLVLPLVQRIRERNEDPALDSQLDLLEIRLGEVLNPFCNHLLCDGKLTDREIEIAERVRAGKTTKQISEVLGITAKGVEFHRMSIRRKLGIAHSGENLRSYLLRLPYP